jgi:hypothetical protein
MVDCRLKVMLFQTRSLTAPCGVHVLVHGRLESGDVAGSDTFSRATALIVVGGVRLAMAEFETYFPTHEASACLAAAFTRGFGRVLSVRAGLKRSVGNSLAAKLDRRG